MAIGRDRARNWRVRSVDTLDLLEALEIRNPEAVEMMMAGIWLTSPSPIASRE